ncbi:hypothetical protein ACFE04_026594 [Oxalis oulophora]
MGFPVGYPDLLLPKLFLHALSILGFIRSLVLTLFRYLGLSDFFETDTIWPDYYYNSSGYPYPTRIPETQPSIAAALIREILPVIKIEDVGDPPESCVVCLYEFEVGEEIRWLSNCKHIFHRSCLDRWMDHDQKNCPLCRTPFVPHQMQHEFNQRLLAATGNANDFDTDYTSVRE